jgi:hypothetical protein
MECRSWTRTAHSAINLDEIPDASSNRGAEFIAVDNALQRQAEFGPRKTQVVELLRRVERGGKRGSPKDLSSKRDA